MRIGLIAWVALVGCQTSGSADIAPVVPPTTQPPVVEDLPVVGLDVAKVTANQGIQISMYDESGDPEGLQAPVIRGRSLLLRVFVDDQPEWENRKIRAVLELETAQDVTVFEEKKRIKEKSKQNDLDTTINFFIEGDQIKSNVTKLRLDLYEDDTTTAWAGSEGKTSWNSGQIDTVRSGTVEVVMIPVQYNYDGSGRLPDTTDTQMARYSDLINGMYPAEEVNITVSDPLPWSSRIDASGSGWSSLLNEISDMRDSANVSSNTYYYGVFNPANTLIDYCGFGCVLGLSNLGWSASVDWTKSSIGVGFTGTSSAETFVHEVGHAHGREHAPCGVGDADWNYPHANARLGAWGYNLYSETLYNPEQNYDMMSYCGPIWLSDYTYYNLMLRIQETNDGARHAKVPWTTVMVDEEGTSIWRRSWQAPVDPGGSLVDVELYDDAGALLRVVQGHAFEYSHVPGGTVLVPPVGSDVASVIVPEFE